MPKIFQEWYCTKSGGGCGGYITVPLDDQFNGTVELICPNCNHRHQRTVHKGQILEDNRFSTSPTWEIQPVKSAYSKESRFNDWALRNERDGRPVDRFLRESWFEKHGGVQ